MDVKPSDFVYSTAPVSAEEMGLDKDQSATVVIVTANEFWRKNKAVDSVHLNLPDTMLPRSLNGNAADEIAESMFIIEGKSVEQVEREMLILGYLDDNEFREFVNQNFAA